MAKSKKPKPKIGTCKRVFNKKTGCSTLLCYTGKGKTGWTFKKGSTTCSSRRRRA